MVPNQEDYIDVMVRSFQSGLDKIQSFERWGKHSDLRPYYEALEEWDDKIGEDWDEPDSIVLDPSTWISEDPLYTDQKEMVRESLESAFEKAFIFLTRF